MDPNDSLHYSVLFRKVLPMRALFFLNSFVGGGAEKVCLNLARQLNHMDIESDFVIIYKKKPDYEIPEYINIFSLDLDEMETTWLNLCRCLPKVNEYLSNKDYCLITAHLQPSQRLASLTSVGKRCLYVMHASQQLDDVEHSLTYRMKLCWFLRGKRIITVSNGLKQELGSEYGINSKRITTIYNPCNIRELETDQQCMPTHMRPYILVMGRLEEQKNPLCALELYYKGGFYNEYDLIYLGKGSLEDNLRKKIDEYNMQQHVFLVGFKRKPTPWLRNASLLLLCSRQEGFSLSIAEALICGTPVVASDCPHGPKEILKGKLADYLIYPESDFQKSIDVIASALESYPEITTEYYEEFDDEIITRSYLEVWKRYFG